MKEGLTWEEVGASMEGIRSMEIIKGRTRGAWHNQKTDLGLRSGQVEVQVDIGEKFRAVQRPVLGTARVLAPDGQGEARFHPACQPLAGSDPL